MSRLEHRTDEGWLAYDHRALAILLGLLSLLWGLWYIGHGPNLSSCAGSGAANATTSPAASPVVPAIAPTTPIAKTLWPASVEVQSKSGQLRLIGRVDSNATKSTLGDSAVSVYGPGNVVNELNVDATVGPASWQNKAKDVFSEVKGWGPFGLLRLDGSAITLAGAVAADAEKADRGTRLAAILGPDSAIDNRLFVVAPPQAIKLPASVELRTLDDGLHLSGRVGSASSKNALTAAATEIYGTHIVTDTLVADSEVAELTWSAKAAAVLGELKSAGPGKALIALGNTATLAGVSYSESGSDTLEKALSRILGNDIMLDNRLAVVEPPPVPKPAVDPAPAPAPAKSPASVHLQSADGKLKLLGHVDTEATRKQIAESATAVFGASNVTNEITISEATALLAWQGKSQDILEQLKSWGSLGMVRSDGTSVTLTGTAASAEEKDERADALQKLLGSEIIIDNLTIVAVAPPVMATVQPEPVQTPAFDCDTIARGIKIGFESGRSLLDATGRRALDDVISCLTAAAYEVTGHTDSVGTTGFNDILSRRRAEAVVTYLKARGVTKELKASGLGSSRPVASNALEEGRAQNRRIEFKPL